MRVSTFLISVALFSFQAAANQIPVKNLEELRKANSNARPGDTIILKNGEWNTVQIRLDARGTKNNPIIFQAETPGKVVLTGHSSLRIGGDYLVVDGFYFKNGFAGSDAVIKFNTSGNSVANNCRVTNTVIDDFNNPKRRDENYWVALYGKNNRLDHCSFLNKKNIGVLLAVILDDDRSRENNHTIDHNYFGVRLPLASNGGEIIRIGVSQHCEFNSNTLITDNFFENCDGETEIISIKSGGNIIRNNLFKECQGAVVFRHGNNNTLENNVFLGNNKAGTGGVRIINKGQWIVNNFFYQCRGEGFRSPLSLMNGVLNSPANRYVAVSEAVIAHNTFSGCRPFSLCEGSDTERTVVPRYVYFMNNVFYSPEKAPLCRVFDDISGIEFSGNLVSTAFQKPIPGGFFQKSFPAIKKPQLVSFQKSNHRVPDSLVRAGRTRLSHALTESPGIQDPNTLEKIIRAAALDCGANWYTLLPKKTAKKIVRVNCVTAAELIEVLEKNQEASLFINLTGTDYQFPTPLFIKTDVQFYSSTKKTIRFSLSGDNAHFFLMITAGKTVRLNELDLNLENIHTGTFISTDTSGSAEHSGFQMTGCRITGLQSDFFTAAKSSVSDSIIVRNSRFIQHGGTLFRFNLETDKAGYYNVEKLVLTNNSINGGNGPVLTMMRGGNDESTMGPKLIFSNNNLFNCHSGSDEPLIRLYGTQHSLFEKNSFRNCNTGKRMIQFEDAVRANHRYVNNQEINSGAVLLNKFVVNQ